jgi:hypothetical protein
MKFYDVPLQIRKTTLKNAWGFDDHLQYSVEIIKP